MSSTADHPVREIHVQSAGSDPATGGYPVRVGPGALDALPGLLAELAPAFRYAVIGDARVVGLHGGRVATLLTDAGQRADVYSFPPGESHKNREEWSRLTDALLDAGFGRDSCIIAFGGGVSGDLAGFVAATYMRGVPVVQVPTSLVAMVDSSVGGKTGVDVSAGKNLVGAFHAPRFVLADTRLAATLPPAERSQGLAEAVKHGAILDAEYLERIRLDARPLLAGVDRETADLVVRSVELKAGVVSRDEREAGMRQILNFGHTLGHALEAASGFRLPHGSAVAVGMVLEARLGEALGVTASGTAARLEAVLRAVHLPVTVPGPALDADEIAGHLAIDKKAKRGEPRFVFLEEPGRIYRGREPGPGAVTGAPTGAPKPGGSRPGESRPGEPGEGEGRRSESPGGEWSHAVPAAEVRRVLAATTGAGI